MQSSTPVLKFLLDENVRIELFNFLKQNGFDVTRAPKSAPDNKLQEISKRERRILITNDEDFIESTVGEIFAVIWLKIPQNKPEVLLETVEKLTREIKDFSERLFVLKSGCWDVLPLPKEVIMNLKN